MTTQHKPVVKACGGAAGDEPVTIGSKVICLRLPEYGAGTIVDISKTGLLDIVFDDDYRDWFHPQEVDLVSKRPTLTLGTAA